MNECKQYASDFSRFIIFRRENDFQQIIFQQSIESGLFGIYFAELMTAIFMTALFVLFQKTKIALYLKIL